jgi:hypothetical protein
MGDMMRIAGSEYRQRVADFRRRLNDFASGKVPKGDRPKIDPSGRKTRVVPSTDDIQRFTVYGRRRLFSVARIAALFEIMRDSEDLTARAAKVKVNAQGAFWQAFQGTVDNPACHTCPALLMLDGYYPTLLTSNMGLRRHIVLDFADCMRMPVLINKIDRLLDDNAGWAAFEQAGSVILNSPGVSWAVGVGTYKEGMRDMFPEMVAIIGSKAHFADPELQLQFDACQAFYEGLFLTSLNSGEINRYAAEVKAEMGRP